MTLHVSVIGAGMVGAFTAIEALRAGHRVTLIDPVEPGSEQAASFGNGAWISPASILPVSMPGLWRKVPAMLADPLSPFAIRWQHLPRLTPWLLRFLAAGSSLDKVEAVAEARHRLVRDAPLAYRAVADEAGLAHYVMSNGLLHVFADQAEFAQEKLEWEIRTARGVRWRKIEQEELRALEPGLADNYRFGILVEDGAHLTDPGGFVAALTAHAVSQGATLLRSRVTGFEITDGRLNAVQHEDGSLACDLAILCTGAWSKPLAAQAGDAIPLESERGYHVVLAEPDYVPRHPVMPKDGKMAITMTEQGLRVAGQVELSSLTAPPDWRRAGILLRYLPKVFPALARQCTNPRLTRWMGHRPSTPDGLPCLGRSSACRDILYNFGHGHSGIAMAPASARTVIGMIGENQPRPEAGTCAPQRFRRRDRSA